MHHPLQKYKKGPDFHPILSSGRPTENHPHFRPAIPDTLDWQQLKKSTNNHKQQPSDQTDDERKQDGKCELKTQNSDQFHENTILLAARHHPAPPFVKTTTKIFRSINHPPLLQGLINTRPSKLVGFFKKCLLGLQHLIPDEHLYLELQIFCYYR